MKRAMVLSGLESHNGLEKIIMLTQEQSRADELAQGGDEVLLEAFFDLHGRQRTSGERGGTWGGEWPSNSNGNAKEDIFVSDHKRLSERIFDLHCPWREDCDVFLFLSSRSTGRSGCRF